MIQFKIWLRLAVVHIAIEPQNKAINCIQEASLINLVSQQVKYKVTSTIGSSFSTSVIITTDCLAARPDSHLPAAVDRGEAVHPERRLGDSVSHDCAQCPGRIDLNYPKIWFLLGQVIVASAATTLHSTGL